MTNQKNWTHTLKAFRAFIDGYAKGGYGSFGATNEWGRQRIKPPCSFFEECGGRIGDGDGYQPGFVYDVLLNRGNGTYYVSIFFSQNEQLVRYRVVRFHEQLEPPLERHFYGLGGLSPDKYRVVDEGSLRDVPDDSVENGERVAKWLQMQIDHDQTG